MESDKACFNNSENIRHCAFCLDSISPEKIKLCGKCQKRSYCSRECQVSDWSPKGTGQGHKNWCNVPCGEEDIDWEVVPINGKGLGIIAKHFIPPKFRIMIDSGRRPTEHRAINELMPIGGTFEEKFELNCLGTLDKPVLCWRISRANHSCDSNADHTYDHDLKVKILFASRSIEKGEEICINYQNYNNPSLSMNGDVHRFILQSKWGIICPTDCICRDENIAKVIKDSLKLNSTVMSFFKFAVKSDVALKAVKQLIQNQEILHSSWLTKSQTLIHGIQIAISKEKSLKQAKEYLEKVYEIRSSIEHPQNPSVLQLEGWMKDLTTHPDYLMFA